MGELSRIVAIVVFTFVLFTLAFRIGTPQDVWVVDADCPSEDSCYADYYDGAWHIVRGDPPWLDND